MKPKVTIKINQRELDRFVKENFPSQVSFDRSQPLDEQVEEISKQIEKPGITVDKKSIKNYVSNEENFRQKDSLVDEKED
jgi:hypothetical protein